MASMCRPACISHAAGYSLSYRHPNGKTYCPILNISSYWPDLNANANIWDRYGTSGDSPLLHATRYSEFNAYPYPIYDNMGSGVVSTQGFTGYFYNPKDLNPYYPDWGCSAVYAVGQEYWHLNVWGLAQGKTHLEFWHLSTKCNTSEDPYVWNDRTKSWRLPALWSHTSKYIGSSEDYTKVFKGKSPDWFISTYHLLDVPMQSIELTPLRCKDIQQYLGPATIDFRRKEDIVYQEYLDLDILSPWFRKGWVTAYYAAADSLPGSSNNAIATVFEVASLFKSLFTLDFGAIPKTLGDIFSSSWLKYRYGYCTTKSDISEYISLNDRLLALSRADSIRCYGKYACSDGIFACSFDVSVEDIIPTNVKEVCNLFGLKMSAYNAWDMIPYSFIVDWFIPVGDFLESLETRSEIATLHTTNCWMSYHSFYDDGTEVFLRVPGFHPLSSDFPYVNYGTVSDKTICFRTTDTIALLAQKGG